MSSTQRDRHNKNNTVAGTNHFEMLTFSIQGQRYGVNVFKIKEIIPFQRFTKIPHQSPNVMGVVNIRNVTMPLINLAKTIGLKDVPLGCGFFIITEMNRHVQAVWVENVEQIHHVPWEHVSPAPTAAQSQCLTAVVNQNNSLIGVLDLEALFVDIQNIKQQADTPAPNDALANVGPILVVDDSKMARGLITRCIRSLGGVSHTCNDGAEAWRHLQQKIEQGGCTGYSLIITDIEMPQLDGYTLTQQIKDSPDMASTPVLLHSSLSGQFNLALSKKVGAEYWLSKFNANDLQHTLLAALSPKQGSFHE
jgi:two-component system chemotaxis response regulator CheV